jgi:hypothetical protein
MAFLGDQSTASEDRGIFIQSDFRDAVVAVYKLKKEDPSET